MAPKHSQSSQSDNKKNDKTIQELHSSIISLKEQLVQQEKKLSDQELITKRAQADYVSLKLDMDAYMQRVEEQKNNMQLESMMRVFKQLLPHITNIQQMLTATPQDLYDHSWTQ
jgi:molecular chaperone GrpE (heat shock protein)